MTDEWLQRIKIGSPCIFGRNVYNERDRNLKKTHDKMRAGYDKKHYL